MPSVELGRGEGSIYYGKNKKEHGGAFYVGVSDAYNSANTEIPPNDQKSAARLLRRLADRMDPPNQPSKGGGV